MEAPEGTGGVEQAWADCAANTVAIVAAVHLEQEGMGVAAARLETESAAPGVRGGGGEIPTPCCFSTAPLAGMGVQAATAEIPMSPREGTEEMAVTALVLDRGELEALPEPAHQAREVQ